MGFTLIRRTCWAWLVFSACATPQARVDREGVATELRERAGVAATADEKERWPPGVRFEDGLTRDESIAVALWRNPELAASLAELDVARAAIVEAGLLRDPVFTLLFPLGSKQLEATLNLPLEGLWLRDRRIELAQADAERLASELVVRGLDLVREVQRDFSELESAQASASIAREAARVSKEIARLDGIRAEEGEIAATAARESALAARVADEHSRREAERAGAARRALGARMGLDQSDPTIEAVSRVSPGAGSAPEPDELVVTALACRPDVRAAEMGIEAAAERLGLARDEAWRITAIVDANEDGKNGFEAGPGVGVTLPLLAGARGTTASARAELEFAGARYRSVRARVAHEVLDAAAALRDAERSFNEWRARIAPEARARVEALRRARAAGVVTTQDVLRGELEVLEVAVREAEAVARVREARAELERAVGRRDLEAGGREP